jgi:hypothetical protein
MSIILLSSRRRIIAAPPSGALQWAPNLPAGLVTVGDTSFDTALVHGDVISGWQYSGGGNIPMGGVLTPAYQRIEDASASFGPFSGRFNFRDNTLSGNGWPANTSTATGSGAFSYLSLPKNQIREVYWPIAIRFSAGYVAHTGNFQEKFWYPTFSAGVVGQSPVIQLAGAIGAGGGPPFRLGTYWWDENGVQRIKAAAVGLLPETWYVIEIHQRINTYNAANTVNGADADGFSRIWVNNVLVEDFENWCGAKMTQQVFYELPRMTSTRGGPMSDTAAPFGGMWRDHGRMSISYRSET